MSAGWKAAMMRNPKARLRADGKEQCVSLMINKQFRGKPEQNQAKPGKGSFTSSESELKSELFSLILVSAQCKH